FVTGNSQIYAGLGSSDVLCDSRVDGGTMRMDFADTGVTPFTLDLTWPNCPAGAISYHAEGYWDATPPELDPANNTASISINGSPWLERVAHGEAEVDEFSTFWWINPTLPDSLGGNQPIQIYFGDGLTARPPVGTYGCAELDTGEVDIRASPQYFDGAF